MISNLCLFVRFVFIKQELMCDQIFIYQSVSIYFCIALNLSACSSFIRISERSECFKVIDRVL